MFHPGPAGREREADVHRTQLVPKPRQPLDLGAQRNLGLRRDHPRHHSGHNARQQIRLRTGPGV
ncbi:hypothetical protein, partial [Streptomyces sp. NPDC058548]|uniref:hypothetical protein n=1 Tax=Streptomyces sp. NPDC058548 TaxID=3346545 RepID=UPI003653B578